MNTENPILNNPYLEPLLHYDTDSQGNLDYAIIRKGRRIFKDDAAVMPNKQTGQKEIWEWNEDAAPYSTHVINRCRHEVAIWREEGYQGATKVTLELLEHWFGNGGRKLFFAQQEAVETAIYLNEIADRSNPGQNILNLLREGQQSVGNNTADQLPRIAFKMATGTGKTVVMACLICYHYFNRQQYRNDDRFSDYFLIVAPGVTIKDRLGVLFVDTSTANPNEAADYYRQRRLVPARLLPQLAGINSRLVITNYHTFEPRNLQGNKKSPFDGKVNLKGEKVDTGNKESFAQVLKRAMGKFQKGRRLLVLNDEAHHCYLPKSDKKTTDNEEVDENARAAVWFSGLRELNKAFQVRSVYDLSATPYYLNGSGYKAYSLFPWVVTDFGLIEAIESGLVKIPFLPESDNTQTLDAPVLRDLYNKVMEQDPNALPRKGQRKQKSEAKEGGNKATEEPPRLPALVKGALDQFYNHYREYFEGVRLQDEARANLFSSPPVFIAVCNNTSVSKEMFKYIAGYEFEDENGDKRVVTGQYDLFSNYDKATNRSLQKPPTLLIDSEALDDGGQINDELKKVLAAEIDEFKREYARLKGQGSALNITDAEILREVVNTVGRPGKLGAHIRCVVSVSMLTEGWDANTVTHIMGLRAFGSQLLCEQVAGRALRRMSYLLQGYDKDGNPTDDKRKIVIEKFPPEYAHIIGVPFTMFKGGQTAQPPQPPNYTHVRALLNRQATSEITFPNVVGYRIENKEDEIRFDYSGVEDYEIVCSQFPLTTTMGSAFLPAEETIQVASVFEKREQEICFNLTRELINHHFHDDDRNPKFHLFGSLLEAVRHWYSHKILLVGERDPKFRKLIWFEDPKRVADHIARGINPHINTSEYIRATLNYYNPLGSTRHVSGNTVKEVYETRKSHVNYVVMDSDWEGLAAKTLEEMPEVEAYVKNQFLGLTIPYVKDGKDHQYLPDLVARVLAPDGSRHHLLIEITGMSKDKAEKKWYVENRWLPGVNALRHKYNQPEWHFIEIADDIRDIRPLLQAKIATLKADANPVANFS